MSNRLFQGVIHQMKDAIDRTVGVVDETGTIISCSELGRIGCFGIEIDKLVAGVLKGCGELVDSLLGYSQRFDQGNLHLVTPQ